MAETIQDVFDRLAKHVKIDKKLAKEVSRYEREFVNRNDDHIEFFGGTLTGAHIVRFKNNDRDRWFNDILEIDEEELRHELHSLECITPNWNVIADPMNHTFVWLAHKFFHSSLSRRDKEEAMVNTFLIMHYKFVTSLLANFFRYPVEKNLALATYASLSKKFSLKKHGSWYALLRARSEDIISKRSIHYKTLEDFTPDGPNEGVMYVFQDAQSRIREVIKKITRVFYEVKKSDARIVTQSATIGIDGEEVLRDKSTNFITYKRYIHEIIGHKRSFVKAELIDVVAAAMHTMPPKHLRETLEWMSDHYGTSKGKDIDPLLDEIMEHAFEHLTKDREFMKHSSDLSVLVSRLRALYMSSRSKDPAILKMRKLTEKIVKNAVRTKSPSVIASVRTGTMIYIVLRAFSMNHYTT